jgi:hypothetical protein
MSIIKLVFLIILLFLLKAALLIIITSDEHQLFGLTMFSLFGLLALYIIRLDDGENNKTKNVNGSN